MKDILTPATCVCLFLLCAPREATPEARSMKQVWAAIQPAVGAHTSFTAAHVTVVLVLPILVDLCRLSGYRVEAVQSFGEVLAVHAEIIRSLVTRTGVRA
ncbi:hypothetical protein GCM10022224_095180 [Nonomuraea antimicrobica]|uniref:Secreted protein n=1 Tax=Nonomuraea antimicrobica TaxID=561173 RepID=A0ABP7E597_9ACTN